MAITITVKKEPDKSKIEVYRQFFEEDSEKKMSDPEYEVVGLTLRQRIALWRIILRVRVRVLLGLPVVKEQTPGS